MATPDCLDDTSTPNSLGHIVKKDLARTRYANYILPTLQDPLKVWLTEEERYTKAGNKQRLFRRRFIKLFEGDKTKQGLTVVQENKDGSFLYTFVPASKPKQHDNQRRGFLLYRKEGGQKWLRCLVSTRCTQTLYTRKVRLLNVRLRPIRSVPNDKR